MTGFARVSLSLRLALRRWIAAAALGLGIAGGQAAAAPRLAPVVRIGGRVIGDVTASDRVEVSPSGSLEGNISAPRIVIAEGAFFKGIVDMRKDRA